MRLLSELQDFLSWPHCIMAKMNEKKLEIQNVMSCFSAKEMLTLNVYNFVEKLVKDAQESLKQLTGWLIKT